MRQRFASMADSVFGDDGGFGGAVDANDPSAMERAQQAVPSTHELRQQARGNPMAAGLISFGAGMLLGSILPQSHKEQQLASDMQPQLANAATEAASFGQTVAQDLKAPAKDAAEQLKETAESHADDIKSEAADAASDVRETAAP